MRLNRFMIYLGALLDEAVSPVAKVETFADCDFTAYKPVGWRVHFESGAQIYIQVVRACGPRGDHGDEPIVEGDQLPTVDPPAFVDPTGRVDVAGFEGWLAALCINGGSREISAVRRFSRGEGRTSYHRHGVAVDFHAGDSVFLYFVHTLPPGSRFTPDREYQTLERI